VVQERFLALLEADRVDRALAPQAPQPRREHAPARAVDHDRDPGHLGLGRDEVQECRHRLFPVQQVGVHVHVEQVRAAAYLLQRDAYRRLVAAAFHQAPETGRSRDVGALAGHREAGVGSGLERLETAEPRARTAARHPARRRSGDGAGDLPEVRRPGPAASAYDVDQARFGEPGSNPEVSCGCARSGRRW